MNVHLQKAQVCERGSVSQWFIAAAHSTSAAMPRGSLATSAHRGPATEPLFQDGERNPASD